MRQEVVRALAGGAVGLASTFIVFFAGLLRERSATRRREKAVDDLTKHVAFWDSWLRAYSQAQSPERLDLLKGAAESELSAAAEAFLRIRPSLTELSHSAIVRAPRSKLRRALLIYYPPRKRAWMPRAFFYLSSLYFIGVLLSLLLLLPTAPGTSLRSMQLGELILTLVIVLALIFLFRRLAVRLEETS
jgi:hypothetical protein